MVSGNMHPTELKDKNIAFFSHYYPEVYKVCNALNFERLTLNISESGKIDLFDGQQSLYSGDAEAHGVAEANAFLNMYSEDAKVVTIAPPSRGELSFHRFFSKRFNKLVNSVPEGVALTPTYKMPEFYPLIAFLGSGLGIQIRELCSRKKILNALIFEPDAEMFLASLYITDWQEIILPMINSGKDFRIILGTKSGISDEVSSAHLWNELITYNPSFPLVSLFLNHRQDEKFSPIIENIKKDMHFYLNQWGYYDDEINQMNNAFHNIASGVPKLNYRNNLLKSPAIIVGGGPSLDGRIDSLRSIQSKSIVISCGTAVHSLLKEGITPDIHIEIESHMLTYESLSKSENKDFFEKTLLIGALQLPPNVFNLFKNKVYFVKDSTALASLFAEKDEIIYRATPTCTNSGVAIATHLRAPKVLFFGLDFGFKDTENHHSQSSIYYTDKISEELRKEIFLTYRNISETESVSGGNILTIPMYKTSKRSVEFCIKGTKEVYKPEFYNCSDGAKIEGTSHINEEELENIFNDIENLKSRFTYNEAEKDHMNNEDLRKKIDFVHRYLKTTCRELSIHINGINATSIESLFSECHKINRHMGENHHQQYGNLYFLTRGSIWHFLNAGASIALSITDNKTREEYINNWKEAFSSYLQDLPLHFLSVTSKDYPDSEDPWIREDIVSNEHLYYE